MDYYMLDEALDILEGKDFYKSVDFILQDINESVIDIESVLEAEDGKETIWQKLKSAFKKVINFIKTKLFLLLSKVIAKFEKIHHSVVVDTAKKADKKNQLNKISFRILDFKNFYTQLKSFSDGKLEGELDLNTIDVNINNFATVMSDCTSYMGKMIDCIRVIQNKSEKMVADIEAKKGDIEAYRKNLSLISQYASVIARYTKTIAIESTRVQNLCSKIKANPDEDYTELIDQINGKNKK